MSRIVHPNSEQQPKRPNWRLMVDEKTLQDTVKSFQRSDIRQKRGGVSAV